MLKAPNANTPVSRIFIVVLRTIVDLLLERLRLLHTQSVEVGIGGAMVRVSDLARPAVGLLLWPRASSDHSGEPLAMSYTQLWMVGVQSISSSALKNSFSS